MRDTITSPAGDCRDLRPEMTDDQRIAADELTQAIAAAVGEWADRSSGPQGEQVRTQLGHRFVAVFGPHGQALGDNGGQLRAGASNQLGIADVDRAGLDDRPIALEAIGQ